MTTMTPTPSDFRALLSERGVPEARAQQLVDILYSDAPRLMKFAMLAGALGFPASEAAAIARELDEQRLADEINALAKRAAEAEARVRALESAAPVVVSQMLAVHKNVYQLEQEMIRLARSSKDFAKSAEGKSAWARLGKARLELNKLTDEWIKAGTPGVGGVR